MAGAGRGTGFADLPWRQQGLRNGSARQLTGEANQRYTSAANKRKLCDAPAFAGALILCTQSALYVGDY